MARYGRRGLARLGKARLGTAGMAWLGVAWHGRARQVWRGRLGVARHVSARQGRYGAARRNFRYLYQRKISPILAIRSGFLLVGKMIIASMIRWFNNQISQFAQAFLINKIQTRTTFILKPPSNYTGNFRRQAFKTF